MSAAPKILLISDFNIANLAALISNDESEPSCSVTIAPFGQVDQTLIDHRSASWMETPDAAFVWTQPHVEIPSFARLVANQPVEQEVLVGEVEQFARLLIAASGRLKHLFVATWAVPPWVRGLGPLDMRSSGGIGAALLLMNHSLVQVLEKEAGIHVLDARRWIEVCGGGSFSPKLWYNSKTPFNTAVFMQAAVELKASLRALTGGARKLIVTDLDDTLWGGVVGDVGWENLSVGGHSAEGEARVDFQRALKGLSNRGILLAIASKNQESVALEALERHPEMVLRSADFAGWRINWQDKAANIASLAQELNLGLQSVVFIDDNPAERGRVREALPEVFVPDWPESPLLYPSALGSLTCFDPGSISQEDRDRAGSYQQERQRRSSSPLVGSMDEWLLSLELRVVAEELSAANLQRVTQLLNKTNQMNMSTRRLSEKELSQWVESEGNRLWAFRVMDRFGDSGLTGIVSVTTAGGAAGIVDLVLSCRVMGRNVEDAMLHFVVSQLRGRPNPPALLKARYVPTAKNAPCLEFLSRSQLLRSEGDPHDFSWACEDEYKCPAHVSLTCH